MYFIFGLIIAWFLSLFGIDKILVNGVNEIMGSDLSVNSYFLFFFILGLIVESIQFIRNKGFNY